MNNYYYYIPCPGQIGAPFYSNVGPAWTTTGNYIQFTANIPDKVTAGSCYHFYEVQLSTLPSNYTNIDWNTALGVVFDNCESCEAYSENTPCLNCPPGFTLVNNNCERYSYSPATYSGPTIPISKGATDYAYTKFGLRLYPDITSYSANYPLVGALYTPPTYEVRDSAATPIVPLISSLQSNLWGADTICPTLCNQGRLNLVGIWPTPPAGITFNQYSGCSVSPGNDFPPYDTPICFQYCLDLTETKQYLIGIAGDNEVSITIDGVLVVELTNSTIPASSTESNATFNYWHVFPITLNAGNHIIKLCGINKLIPLPPAPSKASLGAEIYDIDLATFQANFTDPATSAIDCGNLAADIDPYVVFSTQTAIGTEIPDPDSEGDFTCPEGTTLTDCDQCLSILTTTPLPCGYQFIPCCGGDPEYYQISENIPLTEGAVYFYSGTNQCYTVSAYTGPALSLPFTLISINEVTENDIGCNDIVCQLPCLPCVCTRIKYTGVSTPTTVDYYDCNNTLQSYVVPVDGSWGEKTCMKQYTLPSEDYEVELFGDCQLKASQQYECPPCYILEDCDGIKDPIYTLDPIIEQYIQLNKIVKIDGSDTCWIPSVSDNDCNCAISISVQYSYNNCEACKNTKGYKLTECNTGEVIYTTTDLSEYTTVTIEIECPGCWTVEPIDIFPPTAQPVTVVTSFGDCEACYATYYELVDCAGVRDNIYTSTDLSDYLGQIVQIKFCPDVCWTVALTNTPVNPGDVYVEQAFEDCPECLVALLTCTCNTIKYTGDTPDASISYIDCTGNIVNTILQPNQSISKTCMLQVNTSSNISIEVTNFGVCVNGQCPPPPPIGPLRKVRPGYDTAACTTEYYEKVVCNYSEWAYKHALKKRYGISSCCDEELLKWEIKYEMLMLDVLVNPDYTCATASTCNCPSNCDCGYISSNTNHSTCSG